MRGALRAASPRDLGPNFGWIWSASTAGNLADGVLLAAGPLLVASITLEPFAVAMAVFFQRLPWFVFGLLAGAVVDRVDRRLLVIAVDVCRAAVLAILASAVALDVRHLGVVYAVMLLLGTSETFADNARGALVATAVPKPNLGRANSRLLGTMMVTNQLAGPPLGAFIFGLGAALPFGFNAMCFVVAAVLISRVKGSTTMIDPAPTRSVRREVAEGLRWLWSHPPVKTLAVMITTFNVTFGAAFSILVLYSFQRLGLDDFGFGLLMSASAVGGVFGSFAFGRLEKRFKYSTLLRTGLIIETSTHLGLALTRSPYVAGCVMTAFGAHAVIWGTTSTTVRQRLVPDVLLGRVASVYLVGSLGGLALGSLLGGVIGQRWGVVAPFWFAFVGSGLILLLIWRSISDVSRVADAPDGVPLGSSSEPEPNIAEASSLVGVPPTISPEELAARIAELRPQGRRTVLVAIDGYGGSGKTTLARWLVNRLGGTTICSDDFARAGVPGWEWHRFDEQVLAPLVADKAARYQRYDWDEERLAEWHEIEPGGFLFAEGVSISRKELGDPWNLKVWVECPYEVRLERGLDRDGEAMRETWDYWMLEETRYVEEQRPHERADYIVLGYGTEPKSP
jgi:uridine kinase/MFS family permease